MTQDEKNEQYKLNFFNNYYILYIPSKEIKKKLINFNHFNLKKHINLILKIK